MQPIVRVPIVQQVEENIHALIQDGTYQPGQKLPAEKDLCASLGVGRGTVREAFRLLQAKGVVEIKPGRGAFVAEKPEEPPVNVIEWLTQNEQELRDSTEIRSALEPLAARRMAQVCTQEQIDQLEQIHERFVAAVNEGDCETIAQLDEAFHSAIMDGSGNALIIDINRRVAQGVKTFRIKTFQVESNARNAVEPHNNILQAIRDHDGARAETEMRLHLDKVQHDLTDNIENPRYK